MLRLERVTKTFRDQTVIHEMDVEVQRGETKVLLGTSGCGKSTLLRLMMGLIEPTTGTVLFDEQPILPENALALRQRVGYVIQDGGLFPHLTARANATMMADHLRWDASRISERIDELAALTHLPVKALDRYPAQLSGGQRQRVSLIRSLMLDPDVMLMDEPLGALDPITRADLQQDLREIFRSLRKTVVLVTHDIGEAAYFGDNVILLRAGRIVQEGTMADMLRRPSDPFVTHFINAQRARLQELESC